jgi:hypothetical protein
MCSNPTSADNTFRRDPALISRNAYGTAYEIDAPITTPSGRTVRFVSVWQVDTGSEVPRFITMYPG